MSERDQRSNTPDRKQNLDDRNKSKVERTAPQQNESTEVDQREDQIRDQFSGDRTERGPGQKQPPIITDPNDEDEDDMIEREDQDDDEGEDVDQPDPDEDEEVEE